MSLVEKREINGNRDQFPIGMRVLAVDDDPICLKLIEALLRRCQYHVITTNQAVEALRMLRENRDGFDLVISDVHMPDMDGFKLLELVGLEMDLPVIMLSADGETQAVLKGITHGAVDYLLKPVRIEELKNIWQHVVRRKKFDPKDPNNADSGDDCDKGQLASFEGGQGSTANGSSDRNGKINRKRRELDEEGEDDDEESDPDNEDPSAQKKPRVVWSRELHKKFVDAVNQLGIDKAVPKRILDLMNVERLTRENVASHLQKYRIFLKKMSIEANLQANMAAAFRGRDPSSYLPMGSLDGYANFNALVGPRPLSSRSSFQPNGALPKINELTGFGLHGLSGQLGHSLNTSTSINELGKHQGISLAALHGMPTSLELEKLQQPKAIQEASSRLLGGFSGSGVLSGHSNSFASVTKSPLVLQASQNKTTHSGGHTNQSSTGIPSLSSDPFDIGFGDSSHFADPGRCNETWRGATPSTKYPANTLPSSVAISRSDLSSSTIRNNVTPTVSQLGCSGSDVTSSSVVMAPLVDPMIRNDARGIQSNASSLLMRASANGDAKLLHYGSLGNSKLNWQETNQAHVQNSSHIYNSLQNSSLPNIGLNDRSVGNQTLESGYSSKNMDMPINRQTSFGAPFVAQDLKILKTAVGGQFNHKGEPFSEDMKLHNGYGFNSCSLDDLVNSMIKSERDDFFFDGNMACDDNFPLGACM